VQIDAPIVVEAAGELDLDSVGPFRSELTDAVRNRSHTRVIVDLRQVTFIDSTTLAVLVHAHNRLASDARRLTIRTQQPLVLRLFEITGLTALLEIQD
jgi:anti-anti-sigma factor